MRFFNSGKTRFIDILFTGFFLFYIFSILSLYISPATLWIAGLLSFMLPVTCLAMLLAVPFCFILRLRLRWLALIGLLPAFWMLSLLYKPFTRSGAENETGSFKVLSFNTGGYLVEGKGQETVEAESWIAGQHFDVVCLQEYFPEFQTVYAVNKRGERQKRHINVSAMSKLFPYHYFHKQANLIGVATFSKYPITDQGLIFTGSKEHNKAIYTDIMIHEQPVRFINLHLESNLLGWNQILSKDIIIALKVFIRNQQTRSRQIDFLTEFIRHTGKPVILTGDFNETQFSYAYFRLRKHLKNTFEGKGKGLGATFRPGQSPLRIDHQFYSGNLQLESFRTLSPLYFSEHTPLVSTYIFR